MGITENGSANEPRARHALSRLILRSAHAQALPQIKSRVCASRRMGRRYSLMLRDASQRSRVVEASALASCCDAPQHEGAVHFGQTKPRGGKNQPAAVGNEPQLRSIVSGLLFTMD